jgi:hemolysin activation/secretion protein
MLNSGIGARWQTTEDFNLSLHSGYELRDAKVNGGDGAALHFNLSYQF